MSDFQVIFKLGQGLQRATINRTRVIVWQYPVLVQGSGSMRSFQLFPVYTQFDAYRESGEHRKMILCRQ